MQTNKSLTRVVALASTASALALGAAGPVFAQDATDEVIVVTATRRAVDIQDVPLNIAAVGGQEIEELGAGDLSELSKWVPGLHVVDQGGRSSNPIVVRGLNADPQGANDGANDGGGTVATYLGEIPIFVDLKLNDMERVEVLLGPQGTLYGAGTLGGAIRYIPNRPQFDAPYLQVRGDAYGYSEGEDISSDVGLTMNIPVSDTFALRASVDALNDTGFIDYNFVVQEPGVSDPEPDFNNPADVAANLRPVADANTEEVLSGRIAARWNPIPQFDATLTYYFQDATYGGRTLSHRRGLIPVEEYETTKRVLEPNERNNRLLSLEMSYDLGWGTITSATGASEYEERGQRDQTDFLIGIEYSYEAFPSFTAFTEEWGYDETVTQELRLVTDFEGPFNFIVGAFYNHLDQEGYSKEFAPNYDEFLTGFDARPDDLEYYNFFFQKLFETAVYGEATWEITPNWRVTAGGRWYEYQLQADLAVDLPIVRTVFGGEPGDSIVLDFEPADQGDDGFLYKFNTSYDFTDDLMAYFTISQGYRIGNTNGLEACDPNAGGQQTVCAGPNEMEFAPDTTTNYELGVRSQWLDGALTLNGSIFYIDWTDPQVASATAVGLQPITVNAAGARSQGFDVSFDWNVTGRFNLRGAYNYTSAELTDTAPFLIRTIVPPGFNSTLIFIDGQPGDRLPGSPETQASLFARYNVPVSDNLEWDFNYGITYTGDVISRTGGRGGSVTLPAYSLHSGAIGLSGDDWRISLYAENLLDEFAETNVVSTPLSNQVVFDANGDPHTVRAFYTDVLPPRQIGIRIVKEFGGGR